MAAFSGGFAHLHFAFAALARLSGKGRAETLSAEIARIEAFAELLLHLAADLVHPPAEHQYQRHGQYQNTHNDIQKKQCDALQQRRSGDGEDENDQNRQRIALHESHQSVYDCGQKIHCNLKFTTLQR